MQKDNETLTWSPGAKSLNMQRQTKDVRKIHILWNMDFSTQPSPNICPINQADSFSYHMFPGMRMKQHELVGFQQMTVGKIEFPR